MFEDSLMESGGRFKTKSKWWAIATFTLNGLVLLVLILIPIIYPEALPRQTLAKLLVAPQPPAAPPAAPAPVKAAPVKSAITNLTVMSSPLMAPRMIPATVSQLSQQEASAPPSSGPFMTGEPAMGVPGGILSWIVSQPLPDVKVSTGKKITVSSGVAAGNLINSVKPEYPQIAKAARIQGTVVVQATISKTGVIENARAVSGPELLRQAAVEGVRLARYRPYLLNGEPVEVETKVNVIFSLGS